MKILETIGEYLGGALLAVLNLFGMLVGGVIGLFELPRYLRLRSK